MKHSVLKKLVKDAIKEDAPTGDITSTLFVDKALRSSATIFAKQALVLFGVEVATLVFKTIDPSIQVTKLFPDGSQVKRGAPILVVSGNRRAILLGERVALNFLQHLCGIATMTQKYTKALSNSKTKLLDTRKTIPGLRALQKEAVLAGGGENHRQGLSDMVLIKENHLHGLSFSQIAERVSLAKKRGLAVEIECTNLKSLESFLTLPVDVIMLDNMLPAIIKKALDLRKTACSSVKFEVSGNVTLPKLATLSALGVEYISAGSITHSVVAADLSLLITNE